jgi:hypothetical protein
MNQALRKLYERLRRMNERAGGGLLISEKGSDSDLKRPDLWLN